MNRFLAFLFITGCITLHAQVNIDSLDHRLNKLSKDFSPYANLRINGWMQPEFQYAASQGEKTVAGGDFAPYSNNRFILRRSRIKFTYTYKNSEFVLQPNFTQDGINITDFYVKTWLPKFTALGIQLGCFNRPFGYEIGYSSSLRETPERSRFTQTLFPQERDLGAAVILDGAKLKKGKFFRLDAGFFNGTGLGAKDFDSHKDLISHLKLYKNFRHDSLKLSGGFSFYNGLVTDTVQKQYDYSSESRSFVATMPGGIRSHIRRYAGMDLQFAFKTRIGETTLRAEYINGIQPGGISSTVSPAKLNDKANYQRTVSGMYFYFVQDINRLRSQVVFKYDTYDPNTRVKGHEVASAKGFGEGDVRYNTLGFGYNYFINDVTKFMVYYDHVVNETTQLSAFGKDLNDDLITCRIQIRF